MALEGTKYIKIPIAYSDGRERNMVIAVFYGQDARPSFTADGFGANNKTHTAAECLAYLKEKTGVLFSAGLTPVCTTKALNETKELFGENNILATTQPTEYGIHEFDGYFYGTDGESTTTRPNARVQLFNAYGGQLHSNYSHAFGSGGGVFVGNDQRQIFLPLVYINPYPVNQSSGIDFREYKLHCDNINDPNTYYIEISNSVMPFAQFWRLAWTKGGMELINERSSDTPPEERDPLEPGGTSTTGGGTGTFSDTGDTIGLPDLPTLGATDTGFVSLYNPSLAQLKALASYMWQADPTTIEFWKKIVANPIDLILGLSLVPVAVPDGGQKSVKVGFIDTGVTMTQAASQYVRVDCGELDVQEFWGSCLDYAPYTRIQIALPFCGVHQLDPAEVQNKRLRVVYHVDLLSGGLMCYILSNGSVLYQFLGQCSQSIPLNTQNFATTIASVLGIAGAVGSMVGSGGMTAPQDMGTIAANVANSQPEIEHSGVISGPGAQLGVMKPYLIVDRPRQSLAVGYNKFNGYPSNITETLKNLTGFTQVESIHLENIPATEAEKDELLQILQEGFII